MKPILIVFLISAVSFSSIAVGECKNHIELLSAAEIASEFQKSEIWVVQNWKINLWTNQSPNKGPQVGQMRPGSRAVILEEGADDYKVRSPLDKSEGWVSKIQVKRTLKQDTETFSPCS
jgi:hypothetical protein